MAAAQQVALQPALAVVLGEHLHHPSLRGDVLVLGAGVHQAAVLDLEDGAEPVGVGLVGAEEAERLRVGHVEVAQQLAEAAGRFGPLGAGLSTAIA